ncbi:ABC transporter substrate-binding protein [Rhizobium sp. P28RR-XV]|uniref:ABC transporter substrate-binding protein n=1 Tax=Rhizobium sp. P28RR-XV TaxID=2726737 RepID=UPI0014573AB5|nr:ABC transporter substrate-binding protein [Rhizobium sp. P28RR-XV]NLR88202.1 ABC transporter substrate-binding protein [Rhizobium sp. P28RR-XV]
MQSRTGGTENHGISRRRAIVTLALGGPAFAIISRQAWAQESQIKIAIGQRGNWDSSVCEMGQNAGIFKRHGIALGITYTQGGGETIQAVMSQSVDMGAAAGTLGVLGAIAKGAPLRIIGGEMTGVNEMYWYVKKSSPIKSMKDLDGKTVGFSTIGSSTHQAALNLQAQENPSMQLVASGALPTTFTQVMSGQIDVGWSSAPFGLDRMDSDIRELFRGDGATSMRDQTVRSFICHARGLETRREEFTRFFAAYRETLDWLYSSNEAVETYAKFAGISDKAAMRTRNDYFPKAALDPSRFTAIDKLVADGVKFKFLANPLTEAQLREGVQIIATAN